MERRKIGIVFRIPFELENIFETKNEERNFIRHILANYAVNPRPLGRGYKAKKR